MKKDNQQKGKSFFENNSWYHRTKILLEDGTIKYSKKGGFATSREADKSYDQHEAEFKKAYRAYQLAHQVNTEAMLKDYLIYWFEEVFSQRVESTTRMVGAYALYDLILPHMEYNIKLRYTNPVTGTKPYKKTKPKIIILSRERIKVLLKAAVKITGIWRSCWDCFAACGKVKSWD